MLMPPYARLGLQINVRIPLDALFGDVVPVELIVGNATSQPRVTLAH
jgi:hypothetical protein